MARVWSLLCLVIAGATFGQVFPDSVVAEIPVGGDPTNVTALPNGEYLYVGNETVDYVTVVRLTDRTVTGTVATGASPWELTASPSGDYVYVSNQHDSSVSVIRTADNVVVATVPVGRSPCLMVFRPTGDFAYVSNNGAGTVSVIRTADNTVVATIDVGSMPRGITCLPDGQYVYVANLGSKSISVIRTADNSVVATLPLDHSPHRVCATSDGIRVYISMYGGSKIFVMRTSDYAIIDSFVSGSSTVGVTMLPGTEYAYIVNSGKNTVSVAETSVDSLVAKIPTGHAPWGVAAPAAGDFVYTANRDVKSVTVIGYRHQHDVCPTSILAPAGIVDSGITVEPTVLVKNQGTAAAIFPITMQIGSAYSNTVQDTLPPGSSDTVRFPFWTAGPVGTWPVVCFTGLTDDENPANDTITDSVLVFRMLYPDVGLAAILSPPEVAESGLVYVPRAVVRSYNVASAPFPVTMEIGSDYAQTVQETLVSVGLDTVVFPSWTAGPVGSLAVTCFTALAGDGNPTNDTIRDSVQVVPPPHHDVGAVAIVSPTGSVRAGDTVTPRARIRNLGNRSERYFDVRFRIGASYSEKVNVADVLPPGSTAELAFPPWVAEAGTWAVSCSTMLGSDENRANDKVSSSLQVVPQSLSIAPDQSDRIEAGQSMTYRFYALIQGDTGGVVVVARPSPPPGWNVRLCNATGSDDLTDTDEDGIPDLGYVAPGESGWFSLDVAAPSGTQGDTASLSHVTFLVAGHVGDRPDIADTALLNLALVPTFSVHNFPNPFSGSTTFVVGLPEDGKASLTVYTRDGARVCRVLANADMPAGVHLVRWDGVNDNGRSLAPGTYEYLLDYVHAGKTDRIRKKLVLTRQ